MSIKTPCLECKCWNGHWSNCGVLLGTTVTTLTTDTTNIQRAIDKQAKLEASTDAFEFASYGMHLRNQAALMRAALQAADERISGAIDMGVNPLYFEKYFAAAKAWADHVNGEEGE